MTTRIPGKKKPPFVPTRTCPHRWCKPLHLAPIPFAVAAMAFQVWNNWIYLLFIGIGILMSVLLPKLIHYRPRPRTAPVTIKDVVEDIKSSPSALDLELQDAKYAGTGWRMLEVRKGWARTAVACDMIFLAAVGLLCTAIFTDPTEAAQVRSKTTLDAASVYGCLVGAAFFGFQLYAHKKATTPRRPKKAWLPAVLRTNN